MQWLNLVVTLFLTTPTAFARGPGGAAFSLTGFPRAVAASCFPRPSRPSRPGAGGEAGGGIWRCGGSGLLPGPKPTIVPPTDLGKLSCKPWAPECHFSHRLWTRSLWPAAAKIFSFTLFSLCPPRKAKRQG